MGAEARARSPSLPSTAASTQSPVRNHDHSGYYPSRTDLATDLSRRSEKTHFSVPDDGSPLVIPTAHRKDRVASQAGRDPSQTSLLIEFFEGAKGNKTSSKHSVRVRVHPSRRAKGTDAAAGDLQAADSVAADTPTHSRHISLGPGETQVAQAAISEIDLDEDEPVDIDLRDRAVASDISSSVENQHYSNFNPSEISSMPPESEVEVAPPAELTPKKARSRSPGEDVTATKETLDFPREAAAALSRERLTQKVIEKLGQEPRKVSGGKSRSRSVSKENLAESSSARRKSGKHRRSSSDQVSDPSLLTASQISESRSYRSGASKSSLNNPKLLETVEDAIRRLILPELKELKKEQKTQRNLERFEETVERDRRDSVATRSTESHEELGRRLSKHSSDPNVRVRSSKRRTHSHTSPSDRFERGMSEETVIRDDKPTRRRSKDKHRIRDAAAGAAAGALVGGALTREALKHHDSQSSVERHERRRRRKQSHSRSQSRQDSVADTDEIFQKHDVPPMPMRSELTGSDLTRDSILSGGTSSPASEHRRHHEIRQIARGSPRKNRSPKESTREYDEDYEIQNQKSYAHDNFRQDDLKEEHRYGNTAKAGLTGAALGAAAIATAIPTYHSQAHYYDELDEHHYGGGHTLSPIQSVASFEEAGDEPQKPALRRVHSTGSLSSAEHRHDLVHSRGSISSRDDLYLRDKSKGLGLEASRELDPHSVHGASADEQYRNSIELGTSRHAKHMSNYTNDSEAAAQEIRDVGLNPQYIGTPVAVESAVASLHESSILDFGSATHSRAAEGERDYEWEHSGVGEYGSPLKNEIHADQVPNHTHRGYDSNHSSPTKDRERSFGRYSDQMNEVSMTHNGAPDPNDPLPEIGHYESKSDISTNPSYIQGTAGGYDKNKPWLLNQTGDHGRSDSGSAHDSLKDAARGMLLSAIAGNDAAGLVNRSGQGKTELSREAVPESYDARDEYDEDDRNQGIFTPQNLERHSADDGDEGYATGPHIRSASLTPDNRNKAPPLFPTTAIDDEFADNPFALEHKRTLSGNSHGMGSPFYDASMGTGIDKIQSKDIVALMNHLTVRDAQRSARDTEMLTTLVRSAAEMRNSFNDMKRFIAEQDDIIVEIGHRQHEKTQRVLNGPRPQPPSAPRTARGSTEDVADDAPLKRRSAFRRALRGLGGRNNGDIQRLEVMLNHLLDEVAELKAAQGLEPKQFERSGTYQSNGLTSYENLRDGQASGYEPDGQAGTGSTAGNSGYFSNSSNRQSISGRRRASENRISTVMEADEEDDGPLAPHEQEMLDFENTEELSTPTREKRHTSVPLATPPAAIHDIQPGTVSNENTPRTEKSKKHKTSSSSFLPKFSRWSRTTASTMAENIRNSARRSERPYSQVSQSGSDLQNYDVNETYDPQGDDRIRSNSSLNRDRPVSPLVPSSVSEKPTYHAHRDSMNLQHPQPRPGPTARFQNHLESQVQDRSPISPTSDQFGSNPVLARYSGGASNRFSGASQPINLSPISDHGHSEQATPPPPRPPKIRDDGPLVPPKVPLDEKKATFAERAGPVVSFAQSHANPITARSPNQRKPSGPRAMAGGSRTYTPERAMAQPRTQYRGSPNHIESDEEDVTF